MFTPQGPQLDESFGTAPSQHRPSPHRGNTDCGGAGVEVRFVLDEGKNGIYLVSHTTSYYQNRPVSHTTGLVCKKTPLLSCYNILFPPVTAVLAVTQLWLLRGFLRAVPRRCSEARVLGGHRSNDPQARASRWANDWRNRHERQYHYERILGERREQAGARSKSRCGGVGSGKELLEVEERCFYMFLYWRREVGWLRWVWLAFFCQNL